VSSRTHDFFILTSRIVALLLAMLASARADVKAGWSAMLTRDYETALKEWLPLARRVPAIDGTEQARRAIEGTGHEKEMRAALAAIIGDFFNSLSFDNPPVLSAADQVCVIALSALIAGCRSAVERDGYSRQIELIHDTEAPARLARMLTQLLSGMQLIGLCAARQRELIVKVGLDCIPPVRRIAFEALLSGTLTTAAIVAATKYPQQTVRRALEDLRCHGILEHGERNGSSETWSIVPYWRKQFDLSRGPFPKC
jgi:hypothetical protein